MEGIVKQTIAEQEAFFDAIIAKLLLQDFMAVLHVPKDMVHQRVTQIPVTKANSSVFGSVDYIECVFHLTVFKDFA